MPCFSTITETQIKNSDRLLQVLDDLQIKVNQATNLVIETVRGTFSRRTADGAFVFTGTKEQLAPIGRAYAEAGVRQWAARNGMTIVQREGQKITLQKRR